MKLTKQKLKEIFEWAKLFCDLSYGDGNRNVAGVIKGLKDDTLEIEGYIREDHIADVSKKVGEWIRFDPEDKKTFPPDGQDVIFINGEHFTIGFVFRGSVYCDKGFTPAYWRPLPKPPQEHE